MALSVPSYLASSGLDDRVVRFKWNDWAASAPYDTPPKQIVHRLKKLSHRSKLGFAIATLEFIAWRFRRLSHDQTPWHFAEAAWAGMINWRYTQYVELEDARWQGPVRGSIAAAVALTVETISSVNNEDQPELPAACLGALAEYVATESGPYLAWQKQVLFRFEASTAFKKDDPIGPVVLREDLDLNQESRSTGRNQRVSDFLRRLTWNENEFLASPNEMRALHFDGEPYTWDPENDQMRLEHMKYGG